MQPFLPLSPQRNLTWCACKCGSESSNLFRAVQHNCQNLLFLCCWFWVSPETNKLAQVSHRCLLKIGQKKIQRYNKEWVIHPSEVNKRQVVWDSRLMQSLSSAASTLSIHVPHVNLGGQMRNYCGSGELTRVFRSRKRNSRQGKVF